MMSDTYYLVMGGVEKPSMKTRANWHTSMRIES